MKLFTKVNQHTCIACGACGTAAPDIFAYNERGLSLSIHDGDNNAGNTPVPDHLHDDLHDACDGCPTDSIQISNHPF